MHACRVGVGLLVMVGAAQPPAAGCWSGRVEDGTRCGQLRLGWEEAAVTIHLAMTVHSRRHKFSHKVENIGTIYNRLKVQTFVTLVITVPQN